jgi:hypothetical protein
LSIRNTQKGGIEDESPAIGHPFETNARILPNRGKMFAT